MTAALKKVTHDALELPRRQRAKLAHALIVSIDAGPDKNVDAAWDAEIDRRVREIRTGKVKGVPAEEVFAKLRAKYR